MTRPARLVRALTAIAAVSALGLSLTACGSSDSSSSSTDGGGGEKVVLRVAMGSTGDEVDAVFSDLKARYEKKYPDREVQLIIQENDTYETGIGLQTLLSSRTPPDVYFERPGARLQERIDEGNAADITEAVNGPAFAGRFDPAAYKNMQFDGKTYMVPWSGDVTNVFWYNEKVFTDNNITPPTTWDEFLAVCQKLKDAGVTPLVEGNKDKWTVGSIASHLAARVAGDDVYASTIVGDAPMNSPEMVAAFAKLRALWDGGFINKSVNAMGDEEANTQFLLGKAAMIGIGSWLVPEQLEQAKDLEMGFFNLPTMDGAGNQESVLGVTTGFIVNGKSEHQQEAIDWLAMMSDKETTKQFAEAGLVPMTVDPFAGVDADANTVAMAEMLSTAPVTVTPADNIDVKRADEFYGAAAAVIGGLKQPQEALDAAQDRVASLPKD